MMTLTSLLFVFFGYLGLFNTFNTGVVCVVSLAVVMLFLFVLADVKEKEMLAKM